MTTEESRPKAIVFGEMVDVQCSGEYNDGAACPRSIQLMFYPPSAGPWWCPFHEFQNPDFGEALDD